MKPETNDPRPAYLQVADDLRASISGGTFKPGERLPSGRDLARRYGVAPMTISHALDVLRQEQLVEAYQGRGVFVTDHLGASAAGRDGARQDPTVGALRSDLDQLAERVARIERLIAANSTSRQTPRDLMALFSACNETYPQQTRQVSYSPPLTAPLSPPFRPPPGGTA